jgi:hypothetical protein
MICSTACMLLVIADTVKEVVWFIVIMFKSERIG